jgi:hypothetical protein
MSEGKEKILKQQSLAPFEESGFAVYGFQAWVISQS